jgi:hypothetical protein
MNLTVVVVEWHGFRPAIYVVVWHVGLEGTRHELNGIFGLN